MTTITATSTVITTTTTTTVNNNNNNNNDNNNFISRRCSVGNASYIFAGILILHKYIFGNIYRGNTRLLRSNAIQHKLYF